MPSISELMIKDGLRFRIEAPKSFVRLAVLDEIDKGDKIPPIRRATNECKCGDLLGAHFLQDDGRLRCKNIDICKCANYGH